MEVLQNTIKFWHTILVTFILMQYTVDNFLIVNAEAGIYRITKHYKRIQRDLRPKFQATSIACIWTEWALRNLPANYTALPICSTSLQCIYGVCVHRLVRHDLSAQYPQHNTGVCKKSPRGTHQLQLYCLH